MTQQMKKGWPESLDQVEVGELVQLHKSLQGLKVEFFPVGRSVREKAWNKRKVFTFSIQDLS